MNMPAPGELDKVATEQLAIAIMKVIRSHYLRRPLTRLTIFEVLNALAVAVAATLIESNPSKTRDWFEASVDVNLADFARDKARGRI